MTRVAGWDWDFPARPAGALPINTFDTRHEMNLNHTNVVLERYDPAHTDSDISVNFVEADILLVADTWWNGVYPFIDYSTGGSIDGQIRAAQRNVDAVGTSTIVIPGHGPGRKQGSPDRIPRHARGHSRKGCRPKGTRDDRF
jgi:glyoxylase-like metal-dependent hydrolase (beta-lactamase superfamily II)